MAMLIQLSSAKGDNISTLRPRQNGRHFANDIFKCIFLNENVWISIKISLNFVPKDRINNIPALVQIMAWRRPGDKPLSELMMVSLLTHICVTRPQWVNDSIWEDDILIQMYLFYHNNLSDNACRLFHNGAILMLFDICVFVFILINWHLICYFVVIS